MEDEDKLGSLPTPNDYVSNDTQTISHIGSKGCPIGKYDDCWKDFIKATTNAMVWIRDQLDLYL